MVTLICAFVSAGVVAKLLVNFTPYFFLKSPCLIKQKASLANGRLFPYSLKATDCLVLRRNVESPTESDFKSFFGVCVYKYEPATYSLV